MSSKSSEHNFRFAASLIKIIALVIAVMVVVISRYAFIFFAAAMLPTIFAIFLDKNKHRCLSATICSFNLMGVLPSLISLWQSASMDYLAKQLLANVNNWMVIYGAAFVGQLLYISLPLLIIKLYSTKTRLQVEKFQKRHAELCKQWGIENS